MEGYGGREGFGGAKGSVVDFGLEFGRFRKVWR